MLPFDTVAKCKELDATRLVPGEQKQAVEPRCDCKQHISTVTRIQIDSVMRPRSSSSGRNTSASVTVSVTLHVLQ